MRNKYINGGYPQQILTSLMEEWVQDEQGKENAFRTLHMEFRELAVEVAKLAKRVNDLERRLSANIQIQHVAEYIEKQNGT